MNTTLTLVDLGGAIALLIWGVHMVQTGITRAFGPQLRRMLSYALGNRFKAFLAGVGVTSILQSSTATGLMVTAFAAGGLVDLVPALAVMLGANVGTTLIVQVLSFDASRVSFLFILIGVFMFRRSGVTRTRDLGRVGIGLGLMLIALQHLLTMITPYEDVPSLRMLLGAVTGLPQGRRGRERTARRKTDSNSQSHPRERVSFGDKPTQIPKAMSRQTNGRRRP
jgi:phosphate:Na+ symporter